jgi:hypothetical protein
VTAKSNGVLAWNRAIAAAIRVWRSLPSPKSPKASTRTLRRLAPFTVNGRGASRRKWGRLWPAANTWWRSISRSIRSRAAGSRLPLASRPSSSPTTFDMAARRRMPQDVRGGERDVVGGVATHDARERVGAARQAGHLLHHPDALLVFGLGLVGVLERGEIGRRRWRRRFVVGGGGLL